MEAIGKLTINSDNTLSFVSNNRRTVVYIAEIVDVRMNDTEVFEGDCRHHFNYCIMREILFCFLLGICKLNFIVIEYKPAPRPFSWMAELSDGRRCAAIPRAESADAVII